MHASNHHTPPSDTFIDLRSHLAAIVESSDDAIISKDLRGTILSWNRGAERLYGYTRHEAVGRHISLIVPVHLHDEVTHLLREVAEGRRVDHHDTRRVRRDGRSVDVSLTISPIRDTDGSIAGASVIARDVTERKHLERRLVQLASEDQLTGLLNRRAFLRLVDRHIDHCSHRGWRGAVMVLDLDNFKALNDCLGHGAGDQLLKQSAARLRRLLSAGDALARLGGDEFAILLPEADDAAAIATAESLRADLARHEITIGGRPCATTSIGWALVDEPLTQDEIMIRADLAAYDAKETGGNCVRGYSSERDARFERSEALDVDLLLDGRR